MTVDHTPHLLAVRDQGRRGTCLAFAATVVHEHSRRCRRPDAVDLLSVEMLFWRCKQLDADGADGTSFSSVSTALRDHGQCDDALWTYDDRRDLTAATYRPPAAATKAEVSRRATMTALMLDRTSIVQALQAGQCVIAGIELWDAFYRCNTATLHGPNGDRDPGALHAVCLVGLDDANGEVKVRNSWGAAWGDGGYAWTPIESVLGNLFEAWTVADDLDPGPTTLST